MSTPNFASIDSDGSFESDKVNNNLDDKINTAISPLEKAVASSQAVVTGDQIALDTSHSLISVPNLTSTTTVSFADVAFPSGVVNPNGLGATLRVLGGADNLQFPEGTVIHGSPSSDESWGTIIRIDDSWHVIWVSPGSSSDADDTIFGTHYAEDSFSDRTYTSIMFNKIPAIPIDINDPSTENPTEWVEKPVPIQAQLSAVYPSPVSTTMIVIGSIPEEYNIPFQNMPIEIVHKTLADFVVELATDLNSAPKISEPIQDAVVYPVSMYSVHDNFGAYLTNGTEPGTLIEVIDDGSSEPILKITPWNRTFDSETEKYLGYGGQHYTVPVSRVGEFVTNPPPDNVVYYD